MKLPSWNAESLRFTAFCDDLPDLSSITWWDDVIGEPSESQSIKRREGRLVESGVVGDDELPFSLSVQQADNRIEWRAGSGAIALPSTEGLGSFPDVQDRLTEYVSKWFENVEISVHRMAFGAILSTPVESVDSGYKILNDLVPGVLVDTDLWSDLMLRFNIPTVSDVIDEMPINCLRTWCIAQIWQLNILGVIGKGTSQFSGESPEPTTKVRLELDINTDASRSLPIDSENTLALFRELVSIGNNIASTSNG